MMLTASLIAAAVAVAIAGSNDATSAPVEVTVPAKEKKLCRRETGTGSIMPRTVCRTKSEWELLTERGKADFDRTRDLDRARSMTGTVR